MQYKGNPVSPGIAIGNVYIYKPFIPEIVDNTIPPDAVNSAVHMYFDLRDKAKKELERIKSDLELKGEIDKAKIFEAHDMMLFDIAMNAEIEERIRNDLLSPECAINKTYSKFARLLSKSKDEQIRERVADLKDLEIRLLRIWSGVPAQGLDSLESTVVVVAHDLLPSDTANLDRSKVLAIVTEIGGSTSHTAIIARSYEIPAILGIQNLIEHVENGELVIVDAVEGVLHTSPDDVMVERYTKRREAHLLHLNEIKKYLDVEPVTKDGVRIEVSLNIGSSEQTELSGSLYTDGVGLFRTEFMYMSKSTLPTEEEQYMAYRKVALEFGERPVILRTLDIGGDKQLNSIDIPKEDNPFLGLRALRLCFEKPSLFKAQIRAVLRAACHGNLWLMLPMVGSLDDVRNAKAIIDEVKKDLLKEGVDFKPDIPIGIMIEIPAIALIAEAVVKEIDFASIGTNDLCQYLTATDRLNPAVSKYYQSYHPAMFKLIGQTVSAFNNAGKPISVCGEMGSEPLAATVLIGLGLRKLSMGFSSVPGIKKLITGITITQTKTVAQHIMNCATANEVETYLAESLKDLI